MDRAQQALVVAQVELAVALLVTAALLVESFRQLRALDPGFRPESVVTGRVSLPVAGYADGPSRAAFDVAPAPSFFLAYRQVPAMRDLSVIAGALRAPAISRRRFAPRYAMSMCSCRSSNYGRWKRW